MKKKDARSLSHEVLEEIRVRAVQRVEAGESPEVVVKALGFSRPRIYEWLAAYREGGYDALRAKELFGRPPKLNGKQLNKLYHILTEKNPFQFKFEFALWTRSMVREIIRQEFDVRLSDVSVGRLLRKLGLSPQKPLYRAYQRDEEKVRAWKEEAYPEIKKLAKKEKAQIFFADEASLRSDYHSGTTWAPIGQTPVVETSGARFGINAISAVSPKGEMRFMLFEGGMNADRFIEFLRRLLKGAKSPIYLILDGHPVHRSRKVKAFAESTDGMLRLFVLPPYSPHLNPDEWVWRWLKKHKLGKIVITTKEDMKQQAHRFLRQLQCLPKLVRGFFKDPDLAYIK